MSNNNDWLFDREFLKTVTFSDSDYLIRLCSVVGNYLKNAPVFVVAKKFPLSSSWNRMFFFGVGRDSIGMKLNTDIAPYDFLTLLKDELFKYFPKYHVTTTSRRSITEDEINEERKRKLDSGDNFNIEEYFGAQVEEEVKETGVIYKIFLLKDRFLMSINDKNYLCGSGNNGVPITLSKFMDGLRSIRNTNDSTIRDFIFKNSFIIRETFEEKLDICVDYTGEQLKNFVKINCGRISNDPVFEKDKVRWGSFSVVLGEQEKKNFKSYYEDFRIEGSNPDRNGNNTTTEEKEGGIK